MRKTEVVRRGNLVDLRILVILHMCFHCQSFDMIVFMLFLVSTLDLKPMFSFFILSITSYAIIL